MPTEPSEIDLIDLNYLKQWISNPLFNVPGGVTPDDGVLQAAITGASAYWLWRTGRSASVLQALREPASPFVAPVDYSEWYDGNGHPRLFLRNTPITAVTLLTVGTRNYGELTGYDDNGYNEGGYGDSGTGSAYGIHQDRKSIFLRCGVFCRGLQNVNVQYTAGFDGTPPDIQEAVAIMIAVTYKRRGYVDQGSVALPQGGGTASYRQWETPPEVLSVLRNYKREAII